MMQIVPVKAFQDNYIWVLRDGAQAAVVDPGDAAPVREYLGRERLALAAILVTHHHPDHVGGIAALLQGSAVPVYGPRGETIPGCTHALGEGDRVSISGLGAEFDVLNVPGHTRAHIAYYHPGVLFCGDTLFACGCGRVFEGTAAQLHASLRKLAALPGETQVYCAHEYTLANIRFARAVEPDNRALAARETRERARRAAGEPTLPSTLGEELATNPFLRCTEPAVVAAAQARGADLAADATHVFAAIREWKNHF